MCKTISFILFYINVYVITNYIEYIHLNKSRKLYIMSLIGKHSFGFGRMAGLRKIQVIKTTYYVMAL